MRLLLLFLHAWKLRVCNNLVLLSDLWVDCWSDPKALHKLDFEAFDIFTTGCVVAVKQNLDALAELEIALGNGHSGGCTIFENYAVLELGGHVQGLGVNDHLLRLDYVHESSGVQFADAHKMPAPVRARLDVTLVWGWAVRYVQVVKVVPWDKFGDEKILN